MRVTNPAGGLPSDYRRRRRRAGRPDRLNARSPLPLTASARSSAVAIPYRSGKISPAGPRSRLDRSTSATAALESGTRCSLRDFSREAGTTKVAASTSTSADLASSRSESGEVADNAGTWWQGRSLTVPHHGPAR